jgi:hypothetical protein
MFAELFELQFICSIILALIVKSIILGINKNQLKIMVYRDLQKELEYKKSYHYDRFDPYIRQSKNHHLHYVDNEHNKLYKKLILVQKKYMCGLYNQTQYLVMKNSIEKYLFEIQMIIYNISIREMKTYIEYIDER